MADSIALPQSRSLAHPQRIGALIPGILMLTAVGYAGKWIEQFIARYGKAHHLVLPNIEYVLWAILIGLVISNVIGIPKLFQPGIATYEFWLKTGIVLLGARFLVGDLLRLGGISLVLVLIEIVLSLAFMTLLGRVFKLRPKLTTLLAVGSSICGVSAIIATQGAIDADEEDSSYAIAAILARFRSSCFRSSVTVFISATAATDYGLASQSTTLPRPLPPAHSFPMRLEKWLCWPRPAAMP
jgi:hypothetical protein